MLDPNLLRQQPADLAVQLVLWSPLSAIATGVAGALVVMAFGISLESRR